MMRWLTEWALNALIVAGILAGCGEPNPFARVCYTDDSGVLHMSVDCDRTLEPADAHRDVLRVTLIAAEKERPLFDGCRMQYSAYQKLPVGTDPQAAGCTMDEQWCFGRIGDHPYPRKRSHFRHELMHAALHRLEGDADSDHSDPRWGEVM